jgi:hypothetical protein
LILRDGGKICSGGWDGGGRVGIVGLGGALLACVRLQVPHWRIRRRERYWRRRHDCYCVITAMRFRSYCMSRTDLKTASTRPRSTSPRGSGVRTPKMCKLPRGALRKGIGGWTRIGSFAAGCNGLPFHCEPCFGDKLRSLAPSGCSLWLRLNGATPPLSSPEEH